MTRKALMIMLVALPALLTACNTIQGIGQDLKDGGQAMSHAINGDKPKDQ